MNVYQKILIKLYEVTGGKDSETVDLKELIKEEGFYPSYQDIFQHMNRQGWIAEAGRSDIVKITHWGVKEAKKSQTGKLRGISQTKKDANRLKAEVKEFLVMTEEFANDTTEENYQQVKNKNDVINEAIDKLKANFD